MRDPDDYNLSDIYKSNILNTEYENGDPLEEALFSRAPKQQGFIGEVGTRLFNRLGSKTANIKQQIMDEYHNVWNEFIRDYKSNKTLRKAVGKGKGFSVSYINNFLKHIGIKDADKVASKLGLSDNRELDRNGAGNLIFKSIQSHYFKQHTALPTSTYKIRSLKPV